VPPVPYDPAAGRGAPDCLESVLHALLGVPGMSGRGVSFELATGDHGQTVYAFSAVRVRESQG
jgi:hypothetical protein